MVENMSENDTNEPKDMIASTENRDEEDAKKGIPDAMFHGMDPELKCRYINHVIETLGVNSRTTLQSIDASTIDGNDGTVPTYMKFSILTDWLYTTAVDGIEWVYVPCVYTVERIMECLSDYLNDEEEAWMNRDDPARGIISNAIANAVSEGLFSDDKVKEWLGVDSGTDLNTFKYSTASIIAGALYGVIPFDMLSLTQLDDYGTHHDGPVAITVSGLNKALSAQIVVNKSITLQRMAYMLYTHVAIVKKDAMVDFGMERERFEEKLQTLVNSTNNAFITMFIRPDVDDKYSMKNAFDTVRHLYQMDMVSLNETMQLLREVNADGLSDEAVSMKFGIKNS